MQFAGPIKDIYILVDIVTFRLHRPVKSHKTEINIFILLYPICIIDFLKQIFPSADDLNIQPNYIVSLLNLY